ncbi:WD40-repeat-containing domain protein [Podospora fimiseda]|uniref:WD40-repeat-containing domain protein n=1 Tax=Podospora fimiseda TaxID=252190 RepID=A0AAN7GNM8_9PEZI|nr:WD40-repeat-containing domain protein [Podospora fimiseda]
MTSFGSSVDQALEAQAVGFSRSILHESTAEATSRRIVSMREWQQAVFPEALSTMSIQHPVTPHRHDTHQSDLRHRSVSLSIPLHPFTNQSITSISEESGAELKLEKSRSHGFGGVAERGGGTPSSSKHAAHGNLKRMLRRASVSLRTGVKGLVHRKPSAPVANAYGTEERDEHVNAHSPNSSQGSPSRPTTSHSTWQRLRQAASFHRHSRLLHAGHGERASEQDVGTIESPTYPVPGSGEQPPIIPRSTGAAARQAAASASAGLQGLDGLDFQMPHPGWLTEENMDDRESGIGIALTSPELEPYNVKEEVDSDVDVGAARGREQGNIAKVDFISRLPVELAIQVLAELDASTLGTASLVNRRWAHVIRNQHVWRESFLREKTSTYATSGSVKPGTGLGVPAIRPNTDWREIYKTKQRLDKNWKLGKALPVYLNGHADSIYCLQFDESKIITGSRDRTIRVWDLANFACKLVIGPPEVVNDHSHSILYDESGNPNHYATLPEHYPELDFDFDDMPRGPMRAYHSVPTLYAPPIHHKASILCLQYDDEILVTGSSDSTCIVYNIKAGYRPVRRLSHHSAAVLDLVFDEKHIVTCSKDITICVWDRATGQLIRQLRGHTGPVNAVQMRGNTIVSCSGDFRVKLWNIDTGKNIREFLGHSKGLACSQFSEDGRYIASAGNDKIIRIWDANTGECVREMKAHTNLVRSLHVDSISGRLVSGSYDSDIKVWDMETGQALLDFPKWHASWVLSAKSDYRRIISSGQDPKILILDFGASVKGIDELSSVNSDHFSGFNMGGYI